MALISAPVDAATTIALSFLDAREADVLALEKAVVKARNYHDGEQLVFLTERLKQFLSADTSEDVAFRLNVCRVVVEALAERLAIKGWECADKKQQAWAEIVWAAARMAAVSEDVHEQGLRDGESFLIVDWDYDANTPQFFSHPRYASVAAGGDGFGCIMAYPGDDVSQPPLFAVKRWIDYSGPSGSTGRQRANFYFPDRIEKRVYDGANWREWRDEGDTTWPIAWLAADGKPLGIPVIHFKNKGMRSEAKDAIPVQDGVNKTLVDLMAAGDLTAFRIYVALGFIPTTDGQPAKADGSNVITIEPGTMIGTTAKTTDGADFKAIDGADLGPLVDVIVKLVQFIAMVTSTPGHRFQISGMVAAEGTLKQQDVPLLAKARSRQILFGGAWVDAMNMARRLANKFGSAGMNESEVFKVTWQEIETRSDDEKRQDWETKKAMGVPIWQIWSEMGYTKEQIDTFKKDPSFVFGSFGGYPGLPTGGADTQTGTDQGDPVGDTVAGGTSE